MNKILQKFARDWLKDKLAMLPADNNLIFKRMYSRADLAKPIDSVIDDMSVTQLDWAMQQVQNTLDKRAIV